MNVCGSAIRRWRHTGVRRCHICDPQTVLLVVLLSPPVSLIVETQDSLSSFPQMRQMLFGLEISAVFFLLLRSPCCGDRFRTIQGALSGVLEHNLGLPYLFIPSFSWHIWVVWGWACRSFWWRGLSSQVESTQVETQF